MNNHEDLIRRAKTTLDYDPATGVFRNKKACPARPVVGQVVGSLTWHGYLRICVGGRPIYAHRLAWLLVHGDMPKGQIDHINGNRTDNRISNLRDVTGSQNQQSVFRPVTGNATGFRGVCPYRGRFRAKIKVGKKTYCLGAFDTAEEAHKAYLAGKEKLHPSSRESRPYFVSESDDGRG